MKVLHSRILIYSVWPWYCTWAILQAKIQFKVARYNLNAVFFSVWIPTCASVVKESCSKLGNMGSILAGCWHSLTTWAHMFWGYEKPAEKSQAQVFYFLWDVFYFLQYIVLFLSNSPSHCNSGKMRWQIFAAMLLQCDKPMHFWRDPLKSSFA